jgi:hypothetical protein
MMPSPHSQMMRRSGLGRIIVSAPGYPTRTRPLRQRSLLGSSFDTFPASTLNPAVATSWSWISVVWSIVDTLQHANTLVIWTF